MNWFRISLILIGLYILSHLAPTQAIDPWGLLNLSKFFRLIWALTVIQVLGVVTARWLGHKHGSILMGFLGGIVSSTALTAALAKESQADPNGFPPQILPFLSATLAMICEALIFVYVGTSQFHSELFLIFLGPLAFTLLLIGLLSRKATSTVVVVEDGSQIDFRGTIRLVLFVMAILAVSKFVQNLLGSSGLLALTFLISLFEIHGNVISNTQLHEAGAIDLASFGLLLAVSLSASYVSKIFLVSLLGGERFRKYVLVTTPMILAVLFLSWSAFRYLL